MPWFNRLSNWFGQRPPTEPVASIQRAPDLPLSIGSEWGTGGMPLFPDPLKLLNYDAYTLLRRTDVVAQPVNKLAKKLGMFRLVAVGKGARRDAVQRVCDNIRGLTETLEYLTWAVVEGVRFGWVKGHWCEQFYAPDLRGGGRLKRNAGGVYIWNGYDYSASGEGDVVKVDEGLYSFGGGKGEQDARKAKTLDRSRVIVFRPGAGNNPEGDLDVGYQLYLVAEAASLLDKAQRVYAERHALPKEIIRKMIDRLRPDEAESVLASAAEKFSKANARQVAAMSATDLIEYLEPKGTTFDFLLQYRQQLEERAARIVTDEFITSMGSDKPTGSSKQGSDLFELSALSLARKMSEPIGETLLRLIEAWNLHYLPAYEEGEPPIYLELRPISPRMKTTVAEIVQMIDRELPLPTDWLYETLGCERDPSLPDFFVGKAKSSAPLGAGGPFGGGMDAAPLKPDGTPQRSDRQMEGEETSPEATRQRGPDLRNASKPDGSE